MTCLNGINYVGLTMICYGVTDVLGNFFTQVIQDWPGVLPLWSCQYYWWIYLLFCKGSYLFGVLAKYLGRVVCVLIGAVLNYAMIFLMMFWVPNHEQTYILFIIPGKKMIYL